jgi:hypothetical protein
MELSDEVKGRLARALQDFEGAARDDFAGMRQVRIAQRPRDAPIPALYRFLLVEVCRGADLPRGDKTAWEVGFRYSGIRSVLTLEKFGVRLYVDADAAEADRIEAFGRELIGKLSRAVRLLERTTLQPLARDLFEAGNVTIANQVGWLRGAYEHFRAEAADAFDELNTPPVATPPPSWSWRDRILRRRADPMDRIRSMTGGFNRRMTLQRTAALNTLAAVNAYFSLLEHELVLVLPFVGFDPDGGRLASFIGDRWGQKLKTVFDLNADGDASRHYTRLYEIAETYRNTYSHGGFDKGGAAVWVHVQDVGAIPARLSDIRDSPHFELFPVDETGFDAITTTFSDVDNWLRTSKASYGIRWAVGGLDVAFDEESRARYLAAMASEEEFEEYLERESMRAEMIANFEY